VQNLSTSVSSPTQHKGNNMNANATNRLIAYRRKLVILELLEKQQLSVSQTAEQICDSYLVVKAEMQKLYLQRYLSRKKQYCPIANKPVYAYITKNKNYPMPNIKATNEQVILANNVDFLNDASRKKHPNKINELPKELHDHKHIIVDEKNPHITTYLNLGRKGSDYAWQRPKRKHTAVNIGSTFSLMDSASI
jgi:hypothetical protein